MSKLDSTITAAVGLLWILAREEPQASGNGVVYRQIACDLDPTVLTERAQLTGDNGKIIARCSIKTKPEVCHDLDVYALFPTMGTAADITVIAEDTNKEIALAARFCWNGKVYKLMSSIMSDVLYNNIDHIPRQIKNLVTPLS